MEEGEIQEKLTFSDTYDPSLEWPGNEESESIRVPSNRALCRLVVSKSSVISSRFCIVSLDDYPEVQFGRDAPVGRIPRVRLKEMQVSKLHATIYWDGASRQWNVVDMASKHGTFLRSSLAPASSSDLEGVRLSKPRASSIPFRLRHKDTLTIGSTPFLIHIHDDMTPCEQCTFSDGDEIPLFSASSSMKSGTEQSTQAVFGYKAPSTTSKAALINLKRSLLMRSQYDKSPLETGSTQTNYVDRSARRRALFAASGPDTPGVIITPKTTPSELPTRLVKPEPVVSQPAAPVPATNIGHRLLMMQGWQPGTALGITEGEGRMALIEPLKTNSTTERAGLGMKANSDNKTRCASNSGTSWKDAARQRRWDKLYNP